MENVREERQMILQMLADGKITANEATDLIRALSEKTTTEGEHQSHGRHGFHMPRQPREPKAPREPRAPREPFTGRLELKGLLTDIQQMVEDVADSVSDAVERLPFNQPPHELRRTIESKFTAEEPNIRLALTNGSLKVRPWDQELYRLDVEIQGRAASQEAFEAEAKDAFTVESDEAHLSFEGKGGLLMGLKTDVTLYLPEAVAYQLTAQVGNGKVDVTGVKLLQGSLTTTNGKLVCDAPHAETLLATTGNGAMTLIGVIAKLDAHTSNGSIRFQPQGAAGGEQKLTTGNGAITVDLGGLAESAGIKIEAETAMGGIILSGGRLNRQVEERTLGQKRLVAQTENWAQAEQQVNLVLHSSMGAIRVL